MQLQVEAGVVGESEYASGESDFALQHACGCRCPPDRFDDARARFTRSSQARPRVALLVRDAGQHYESGPGGGQVGRALPVVHRA